MKHTYLTIKNYANYASVILMLSVVAVGFGAVDLVMIAPKGLNHVAAVGQGDLVVAGIYAFFIGVVDVFSSRLAVAEGEATIARRLPVLAAGLLILLVPCQLIGLVLGAGTEPILSIFGQDRELIPLIGDYVVVQTYSIVPVILYYAISEALKICGMKSLSTVVLVFGFCANVILDWAFLYTGIAYYFPSPESAVATSTVVAQTVMAFCGGGMFVLQMRARGERFLRPGGAASMREFGSMAPTALGVGVRHLNDYTGAIVPILFIGTMGVQVLAAAVVATKIYTLFCRVPQACFSGTFVFYGYALGRYESDLAGMVRKLGIYAAIPTAVATLAVLVFSPWLVAAFASDGLDLHLAQSLLWAYMLYILAYFFEQLFGEMLTVHQRSGLLFTASTLLAYGLTIPMAWYSVFAVHSAFLAIASKGLSTAILALIFWHTLRKHCWVGSVVRLA